MLARLRVPSGPASLRGREEGPDGAAEHSGDLQQENRRYVDEPALDSAVVRTVDAGEARGFLLRDALGLTQFPNPGADGLERGLLVHASSIQGQSPSAKSGRKCQRRNGKVGAGTRLRRGASPPSPRGAGTPRPQTRICTVCVVCGRPTRRAA